jgi:hypothetical protein
MPGLVKSNFTSARQAHGRFHTPRGFSDWPACEVLVLERLDRVQQIFAHQVELGPEQPLPALGSVHKFLVARMNDEF